MEKMCFDLNAARRRMRKIFGMVNVYHVKMSWGKVKLDSVITKSLGKMDQEVLS